MGMEIPSWALLVLPLSLQPQDPRESLSGQGSKMITNLGQPAQLAKPPLRCLDSEVMALKCKYGGPRSRTLPLLGGLQIQLSLALSISVSYLTGKGTSEDKFCV